MEISDARKVILRAMALDCDLEKLKSEIILRQHSMKIFQEAIEKEKVSIAEYEYMIAVRETRSGS